MRRLLPLLFAAVTLTAQAEPASPASVEALLAATRVQSTLDVLFGGMEQAMRHGMAQAIGGRVLTPQQQQVADAMPARFIALMREEFTWDRIRPRYVQLYCETFEQSEVDDMLAFYATPAGKALVDKTPELARKSMAMSQSMMVEMLPKMQAAIQDMARAANLGR